MGRYKRSTRVLKQRERFTSKHVLLTLCWLFFSCVGCMQAHSANSAFCNAQVSEILPMVYSKVCAKQFSQWAVISCALLTGSTFQLAGNLIAHHLVWYPLALCTWSGGSVTVFFDSTTCFSRVFGTMRSKEVILTMLFNKRFQSNKFVLYKR